MRPQLSAVFLGCIPRSTARAVNAAPLRDFQV